MRTPIHHRAFTVIELVVVIAIVATLLTVLVVWIVRTRENGRTTQCTRNLGNLVIAMKSHLDAYKRFPPCSTLILTNRSDAQDPPPFNQQQLGTAAASGNIVAGDAGYGWAVMALPYIGETRLYTKIAAASGKFRAEPAFSDKMVDTANLLDGKTYKRHLSTFPITAFQCPSFSGGQFVTANKNETVYDCWKGTDVQGNQYGVAISNYVATTATHIECMKPFPNPKTGERPNGGLVPAQDESTDMSRAKYNSKKAIFTETKEPFFSSWYDGSASWTVAIWPNGKIQPIKDAKEKKWIIDKSSKDADQQPLARTSIDMGPKNANDPTCYATSNVVKTVLTNYQGTTDWKWGPSSDHSSGIVNHAFCDGAVRPVAKDIEPDIYM